tara:strand:- start:365 stop:583 length:219 start_codon:yes stop_codon:yes gene_type:complete
MFSGQKVFYGFKKAIGNIFFHLSGKRFSLDDEDWKSKKSNKIVLIGKNLNHQEIKDQLAFCRISPSDNSIEK